LGEKTKERQYVGKRLAIEKEKGGNMQNSLLNDISVIREGEKIAGFRLGDRGSGACLEEKKKDSDPRKYPMLPCGSIAGRSLGRGPISGAWGKEKKKQRRRGR